MSTVLDEFLSKRWYDGKQGRPITLLKLDRPCAAYRTPNDLTLDFNRGPIYNYEVNQEGWHHLFVTEEEARKRFNALLEKFLF